MKTTSHQNLRCLAEGALMVALATLFSFWPKFYEFPAGGSITLEMLPIVLIALRNGVKWGAITGFVHGILQMIIGFSNVLYCQTLIAQIGCILLDYLLAFSVLGLAYVVAKPFKKHWQIGYIVAAAVACLLRFLCSFLSGILLWGSWAPEGQPVWLYSLTYNGAYMLPNTIIVTVVTGILVFAAPMLFRSREN